MVRDMKEQLIFAISRLKAGTAKLQVCKAYKIRSNTADFDAFCNAATDLFDACNIIEEIKETCLKELNHDGE